MVMYISWIIEIITKRWSIKMSTQTQHPGIVFKSLIIDEDKELNISKVAEMLGITRVALSRVVNGKASLTPDLAARIEKVFNISSALMLKIQASYESYDGKLCTV